MYQALDPILAASPDAKWLTVGDGRYGNDARYLLEQGAEVVATDICDDLLKEAYQAGRIPEYLQQNAESLTFQDETFDYVLCKESYHHFPRPMVALYEMLRVARKGVVLIEPNDNYIHERWTGLAFRRSIDLAKSLLGRELGRNAYEPVGNYLFTLSRREIEKVAAGLSFPAVAFRGINDMYCAGAHGEKLADQGPLQRKLRRMIRLRDLLCRVGLMDYKLLAAVIFKQEPETPLQGYEILRIPPNPYV